MPDTRRIIARGVETWSPDRVVHSFGRPVISARKLAHMPHPPYAFRRMSIPRRFALVGGCLLAMAAAGCSGADSASRHQLEDMRREIHAMQSNNDRLNERVTALELAAIGKARDQADDPNARPDLKVVRLAPGDAPPDDLDEGVSSEDPPTVVRAEGDGVPSVHRGTAPAKGASEAKATEDYEAAMDLVKRKRYDDALEALAGFLVRYPGHPNADNAMYWRGECFYAKGSFVRAAEQFEGVVARFPNGNKLPDALLKLGLSQQQMGEREKAAKTFEQLRKNHPNSDAASKIPRE